jgi:hypothetical protein
VRRKHVTRAGLALLAVVALYVAYSDLVAPLLPSMDSVDVSMASGATVRAGGLQMALYLPRGPFFLGELLPVTVSLSNHSAKAIGYLGAPTANACVPAFQVDLTGGSPPLYTLPAMLIPHCPAPMPRQLGAGRALAIPLLAPLTASGRVTLTAHAMFASVTRAGSGTLTISSGPGPFMAGWPAMTITVAPHVPANRAIHLLHVGPLDLPFLHVDSQVLVDAPRDAASHLLYQWSATCTGMGEGILPWQPLRSTVIHEPVCGSDEKWTIMVSAPGYAVAGGTY